MRKYLFIIIILLSVNANAIYKNVASQKVAVFAYNISSATYATGDAENITAKISKDGGAAITTDDSNPTEIGNGIYVFELTQDETNANLIIVSATSATANIIIDPAIVYALTPERGTDNAMLAASTPNVNMIQVAGSAQAATNYRQMIIGELAQTISADLDGNVNAANEVIYGVTIQGTIQTFDTLDTALDLAHGDGSWEGGGDSESGGITIGDFQLGDTICFNLTTSDPTTALPIKTSIPSFKIYDATASLIDSGSMELVNSGVLGSWKAEEVIDSTDYTVGETYWVIYQVEIDSDWYESSDRFRVRDTVSLDLESGVLVDDISVDALKKFVNVDTTISSATEGSVARLAQGGSCGTGAITVVHSETSSLTGDPLSDVRVWVTTDSEGDNMVAFGYTDTFGEVTFYLDPGDYYVWRFKAGVRFTNPLERTVTED